MRTDGRTDGRVDMTKLTVTFRNYCERARKLDFLRSKKKI
jgi:hypothetical protein